ncbi:MAG: hypothetical protein JW751_32625 [Polyangiaceae bacterium]|nr:hypothetical protein [Polyangiaceae bacterium]
MPDPAVEQSWCRVLAEWDDDRVHQTFLDYCVTTDQLAAAAAHYRELEGDSVRGPRAEQRLAAITLLAISRLEATRTPPPRLRLQGAAVAITVLLLAVSLAVLLYAAWNR